MERKRLLLLLLIPPPYGGGEVLGSYIEEYFRNDRTVRMLTFSRPWANKYTQGKVTIRNLLFGLYYIFRSAVYMVMDRPQVLFFSIPKGIMAFLRMAPLIGLAKILRIKVCGELAGMDFIFLGNGGWQKNVGLYFLRKLHSIHYLGESIAKHHESYGFKNPVVFANGIKLPGVMPIIDCQPDSVRLELLYVGELSRSKGVERILQALQLCRREGLNVFCTLMGEWNDPVFEEEMWAFIEQNQLHSTISFAGLLKGPIKWEVYKKSHVLTHPTDMDGQPLSILEAMGAGMAVISTRIGAIPDTLEDGVNGFILPEISGEALYDAIRKLYFNRDLLHRMRKNNKQTFRELYELEPFLKNFDRWLSVAATETAGARQPCGCVRQETSSVSATEEVSIKRKQILLLLLIPPPFGGGEQRGLRMADYFHDQDDVRSLTFSRPWANKYTQGKVSVRNLLFGLYYIFRSTVYMVMDRPQVLFFSIPKGIMAFLRMAPLIGLAKILRIKVCGELAGMDFIFLENGGWQKNVGLHFLRKMHSIRFLGESIAKHHLSYGFKNPVVFANGIKLPDAMPVIDRQSDSVRLELLYVGELSRSKGVERILQALQLCRQAGLNVFCTLMGEWNDPVFEEEMRTFIKQNQLSEMVFFADLQSYAGKWKFYKNAHVLTHPTDMDGQPLSILEAMGTGMAVISTRIGAIPDTIEDGVNGFILPEISGEALYAAIRKLYFDRDLLHRIRLQSRQTFKERYEITPYLKNVDQWLRRSVSA